MYLKLLIAALTFSAATSAQDDKWTQKAPLRDPTRMNAVAFGIGNKAYFGTGYTHPASGRLKDFWQWDPTSNIWTQKADFGGTARFKATGFSIGAKGYIGMGVDTSGTTSDLWEYDTTANNWTQKPNFPGGATHSGPGFSIGSKGYVLAIFSIGFWEYEPLSGVWTHKSNYPGQGVVDLTAFSIGNKGYAGLGKKNASDYFADFWEYDPATDTWTQKADFGGHERASAVGFGIGTRGFIGTGWDGTVPYKDFWEYESTTNTWTERTTMVLVRLSAVGFSAGNKGYIGSGLGGIVGAQFTRNDFWEYTPLPALDVADVEVNNSLAIYPNPIITTATIHTDKALLNATLTICNATGQQVKQMHNVSGKDITIQREDLPAGIYTISISQEGKNVATGKLVIAD